MNAFEDYARVYELLYRNKPYVEEAAWVDHLIRRYGGKGGRLLDAGCGTGLHAEAFADLGWSVTSIDVSNDMLAVARLRAASGGSNVPSGRWLQADVREFRAAEPFDAVTMLFHVMSYLVETHDLRKTLINCRKNLVSGGLLLFDFWHGPGVLADPPAVRERTVEGEDLRVTRKSVPHHDPELHRVRVEFTVDVTDLTQGRDQQICETHLLRYFDEAELRQETERAGLEWVECLAWMRDEKPTSTDWYALAVARKP